MSNTVDLMIRARFDAVANSSDDRDWSDVLARSYGEEIQASPPALRTGFRRRVPARVALVAAVVVLALVVTAVAVGWPQRIVDFFTSAPAPAPVQHDFSEFDLGAPPGLAPGAIGAQTRLITSTRLSDGSHTLYVSPTKDGGFCFTWTNAVGGCDQLGTVPLDISWGPDRIVGTVASRYVSTVKIILDDGTVTQPDITWISAPINAGFFLYPIPAGKAVAQVDGYDANGTLVSSESSGPQPSQRSSPPKFAVTQQERVALTVPTPDGTATAYVAPSLTAGKCAWFELDGRDVRLYGFDGCMPHGYTPEGIAFRFVRIGSSILLAGAASARYARITLQFDDRTAATVSPTTDGLILYSLPSSLSSSTKNVTITAYRANGQVIFSYPTTDAAP